MKIQSGTAKKLRYPTLATVSTGAVLLVGSACQPFQATGGQVADPLAGDVARVLPKKTTEKPNKKTASKQAEQIICGKARLDSRTGEIIQPTKKQPEQPLLGGSVAPPKQPRKIQKQQPMGRYLIEDWQNNFTDTEPEDEN